MSRIDEIKARLAAATPGPWRWIDSYMMEHDNPITGQRFDASARVADRHFIAHAPEDIEFLLAELERTLDNHNRMAAHLEEMEETIKTAHTERDKAIAAARVATLKEMP